MTKVFIDGSVGTTGPRIWERLAQRKDLELLSIPEKLRKDEAARRDYLKTRCKKPPKPSPAPAGKHNTKKRPFAGIHKTVNPPYDPYDDHMEDLFLFPRQGSGKIPTASKWKTSQKGYGKISKIDS